MLVNGEGLLELGIAIDPKDCCCELRLLFRIQARDPGTATVSVAGCGVWFGSSCRYEKEGTEGGVVWNAIKDLLQHLRKLPSLCAVSFSFSSYYKLRAASFRGDLLVAATQLSNTNCKLAIGYDRRSETWDENDASTIVGVDPTTLIPNG